MGVGKSILLLFLLVSLCLFSQENKEQKIYELNSKIEELKKAKNELKQELESEKINNQFLENDLSNLELDLRKCEKEINGNVVGGVDTEALINTGKYYALIIAVSDYENDRTFTDLPEAVNDGKELKEVLDEYYLFDRVDLLENPTKEAINRQLSGLITEVTNNDNVLIFYAGHGYLWKGKKRKGGYWCPADAKFEVNHTLLNDYEILNILEMIESKNMLLISDACHASSITRTRAVNPPQLLIDQEIYDKTSASYISSGSDSEVSDDSKFFKYLIAGLKENTQRNLSATDLFYTYLKPHNTSTLLNGQVVIPQMSQLDWHELGGDFFFIRK